MERVMKTKWTPNDVEVMLHCHTSPEEHPRIDAQAVYNAIDDFLLRDMIQRDTMAHAKIYTPTPKGRAWLKAILSTPEPTAVTSWKVMPEEGVKQG